MRRSSGRRSPRSFVSVAVRGGPTDTRDTRYSKRERGWREYSKKKRTQSLDERLSAATDGIAWRFDQADGAAVFELRFLFRGNLGGGITYLGAVSWSMATDDSFTRTLLIVIAAILLVPVVMMVAMMPMMGLWGWGHMWGGGAWNGSGGTWMWVLMSLIPLLVILGIGYLLYSAIRRSGTRQSDAAFEELRLAYARGDLSDEEFEERRERLQRDR